MSKIRKNLRSGIFYSALSRYSNTVIGVLISIVLARLLTPKEYGIVAMITVFIMFFNTLGNVGIGPAVVQNKSLKDDDISSIFSFSIIVGLLLAAVFFFVSPIIASFYNEPLLTSLSRLMALSVLFNSLQVVPNALILKKLRFKQIGIISISVHIFSGIIAIILAYLGFSYYALIINTIITGFSLFVLYYYLAPIKPSFIIHLSSIKKIASFSVYQFFFNMINYFTANFDNLLVGKYFNGPSLGLYDRAYKLMKMPVTNLTHVITPVLQPVLSEYENDKKVLYNFNYRIFKFLGTIGFPLSVFLYFTASEIISLLYGSNWLETIPLFKVLSLVVGIDLVVIATGSIFQAANRSDLLFYSGLIGSILAIIGISYGVFIASSLISVCYGLMAARTINFFLCYYLLINRALNYSVLNFLKGLKFPLFVSIGIAVSLWLFSFWNISNVILAFTIKTFISFTVFGIFLLNSKDNLTMFKEYLKVTKEKKTPIN